MDIFQMVKGIRDSYDKDKIEIVENLMFSQKDTLKRVEYYSNSAYLSGDKDISNKYKPFYNIINGAVDVETRSTDFDTKDIQLLATEPKYRIHAMMFRKELRNWMNESDFDEFLNRMGEVRARYGGVLVKRVEKKGELEVDVVEWKNVITDQVDIVNSPIIERHFMSQLDLAKKRGVWDGLDENYEDIMEMFRAQERSNIYTKDALDDDSSAINRIEVLEIQGELPKMYMDENAEDWEFSLQKHYMIVEEDGEYLLHSEDLKESNYKYLPRTKVPGRALGRGVVEDGFEAQTWANDAKIKERDIMEIASKIIFKTTDDLMYDNLFRDLDNGSIVKLTQGNDINPVNTTPGSVVQFQNMVEAWKQQYQITTSTFGAVTGEELPSNTPLGSVQIQNAEARSIFDYRREQAGIFLKEILEDWVFPHIKKKIKKQHILNAEFDAEELMEIDEAYATHVINEEAKKKILNGEIITKEDYVALKDALRQKMSLNKERRFIDIPDNFYDDMEAKVRVVTTNEQFNKQVMLQSLTQIMTLASQVPQLQQAVDLPKIFAQMIEMSGLGLSASQFIMPPMQAQPQQIPAAQVQKTGEALAESANTQDRPVPVNQ